MMRNKGFVGAAFALTMALFILLTTSCQLTPDEKTSEMTSQHSETIPTHDSKVDVADITDTLVLPPESQQKKWDINDGNATMALTAQYEDILLAQLMNFVDAVVLDEWYLSDNDAYKGARSLEMAYAMDTRLLTLAFLLNKDKPEWPKGLAPLLAYLAPAFPFGEYESMGARQVMDEDATSMRFSDVNAIHIEQYQQMLLDDGYVCADADRLYYEKETFFVQIVFDEQKGIAEINVGQQGIATVPLPPWPDPIPDHLKQILPPVAAVIDVTGAEDGFFAAAEQVTIEDIYSFVRAAEEHYGWSALSAQNEMIHDASGFGIRMLSFDADAGTWTLTIFDATIPGATLSPDTAETQPPDDTIGVTEFGYRVTQGRYSEQEAMEGVLEEYGQFAEMADWSDIKAMYGDNMTTFLDSAGVGIDNDVWVQYDGQRFDGDRHYFLAQPGGPRDGFLLYDQIGDEAWLGSWYGIEMPVLVKVPMDQL